MRFWGEILAGLPDNNELVIGVIRKIMPYGAFCVLPEYNNLEAFLHVSEIAPRWIKNIHEFVSEGQRHVLKVHHVDLEKKQVDVSIKRVTESEKKQKLELMKSEKRAAKLLEVSIKASGLQVKESEVLPKIEAVHGDLFSCFQVAAEQGEDALKIIDIPQKLKEQIIEVARKNIKKPVVHISGVMSLTCYGVNGVDSVKKILSVKEKDVSIFYMGAPKYGISLTSEDYKKGEKKLNQVVEHIKDLAMKNNCTFMFEREKS